MMISRFDAPASSLRLGGCQRGSELLGSEVSRAAIATRMHTRSGWQAARRPGSGPRSEGGQPTLGRPPAVRPRGRGQSEAGVNRLP